MKWFRTVKPGEQRSIGYQGTVVTDAGWSLRINVQGDEVCVFPAFSTRWFPQAWRADGSDRKAVMAGDGAGWSIPSDSVRFNIKSKELAATAKGAIDQGLPHPFVDRLIEECPYPVLSAILAEFKIG